MDDDKDAGSLSAAEASYFESRGTADLPDLGTETEKPATETTATVEEIDPEIVEAEAETETDPAKPTGQSKVPLAALTKTRNEAKAEREKRVEAEKKAAVLEDRWNRALALQQDQEKKPAAVEDEIPDPELNPAEAIKWAVEQVRKANEAKQAEATKTEQQKKADQEWQQTYQAVNTAYNAAVTADPLINEARDYLIDSIGNEYLAMGGSRAEAQAEINRIEAEHIRFAHARGLEIGAYVKSLAKARGWTGKAKAADPAKDTETAAADLAKLDEAASDAVTLSDAGGAAPKTMDANAVANMNEVDFAKWLSKNGAAKFRQMAGG
jgi:hypothetical protein